MLPLLVSLLVEQKKQVSRLVLLAVLRVLDNPCEIFINWRQSSVTLKHKKVCLDEILWMQEPLWGCCLWCALVSVALL